MISRLLSNAERMRKGSHVAALVIELVTKGRARSLCCWCAEHVEGEAHRLPVGGECDRCPYVGRECLVVLPATGDARGKPLCARSEFVVLAEIDDKRKGVKTRVYRCPDCNGWHRTSQDVDAKK